jgi:ribosomal protein S18 acetylase RimI-like enzyme
VIVRPLAREELELVDSRLPLHRLDSDNGFYLVAWDADVPVGHLYLALTDPPELQDVWVLPDRRRQGVARALTRAAEDEVQKRGCDRLTLGVSTDNDAARAAYARLGYVETDAQPKRVSGTILIRGEPVEVDDVLLILAKPLA